MRGMQRLKYWASVGEARAFFFLASLRQDWLCCQRGFVSSDVTAFDSYLQPKVQQCRQQERAELTVFWQISLVLVLSVEKASN